MTEKNQSGEGRLIALAGNPNVGKSTVFNALTGMKQHTGNWAGKTVAGACGSFDYRDESFVLADIPGTYSLRSGSAEEETAREFIAFGGAEAAIVVCDATCLERNLPLVLQAAEIIPKTIVCVNLMDEAKAKGISVDISRLTELLGVPAAAAAARSGRGLDTLAEELYSMVKGDEPPPQRHLKLPKELEEAAQRLEELLQRRLTRVSPRLAALRLLEGDEAFTARAQELEGEKYSSDEEICAVLSGLSMKSNEISELITQSLISRAEEIASEAVSFDETAAYRRDRRLDRILAGRRWGIPVMILLLGIILWITIAGANVPSELLSSGLFALGDLMREALENAEAPKWLTGVLIDGIYKVLAWVVSVMLPPMAIFFPLFTLLEDFGYLPRVAFNLDKGFRCANTCGKQAITMAMGFGCNACGVTGCRIIESPRERLIAVLTNSFVPCNGRFPTIIAVITMFFAVSEGAAGSPASAAILLAVIMLGVVMTMLVSRLLSVTLLKGEASSFVLELPPYRIPQFSKVLVRSLLDRTVFVLGRAAAAAAPCGLIIWIMANVSVGDATLLAHASELLDPLGSLMGLDGVILLAFILGFPANEIVMPVIIMTYLAQGTLTELSDTAALHSLLADNGWTMKTALCMMIFTLFHFPCATTCMTIKKETGSVRWTLLGFALPTLTGMALCMLINGVWCAASGA